MFDKRTKLQILLTQKGLPRIVMAALDIDTNAIDKILYANEDISWSHKDHGNVLHYLLAASDYHSSDCKIILEKLLAFGADVNAVDGNGVTPLMAACNYGDLSAVTQLLKSSADVNAQDNYGKTALHYSVRAIGYYEMDIVAQLLSNGANPHIKDNESATPLDDAAILRNDFAIMELVRHGATTIKKESASRLLRESDASLIDCLLRGMPLRAANDARGDDEAVKLIQWAIGIGADINEISARNKTPLMNAARQFNGRTLDFMVKKGADISATDIDGRTALYWAIKYKNDSAIDYLLSSGAEPDKQDKHGLTPIDFAHRFYPERAPEIETRHITQNLKRNARERRSRDECSFGL